METTNQKLRGSFTSDLLYIPWIMQFTTSYNLAKKRKKKKERKTERRILPPDRCFGHYTNTHMTLLLLLVVCSLLSTEAESTADGLLVNSTNGFKYCGWHRGKDNKQSPCRFMRTASGMVNSSTCRERHSRF